MTQNNKLKYTKVAPNFHLFTYSTDRFKIEYNINFTAAGSIFEEDGQRGVSHLLEHCLVGRTKDLDFKGLQHFLFTKDIYTNAATGRLGMNFVTSGHRSDSDTMLDLMKEFAFEPTLTDEVLNQEREIVLSEIDQRAGDPNYRLYRLLIESVFEEGSFALNETLGKREDVTAADLSVFSKIRERMLKKSHVIMTAAGRDIDEEYIIDRLRSVLPPVVEGELLPVTYFPPNKLKEFSFKPIVSDIAHDHATVSVVIPFEVTLENKPIRTYLRELLFDLPTGYIYDRLRNELGLVYSLNYSFDRTSQTLTLDFTSSIEKVPTIIEEIELAFQNFEKVITEDKVNVLKGLMVKRQELSEDDPEFVVDFVVNTFTDYEVILEYREYIQQIKAVSMDDIRNLYDVIAKNLARKQVVVVSNKKEIEDLVIK